MIKLEYILTPIYGEWKSVSGKGTVVEFILGDGMTGTLYLGGRRTQIQNGRGRLDTAGMPHGQYTPYFLSDAGETTLEAIILSKERITPAPTEDKIHRASLSRIRELEKRTQENKERIDELTTLIKGTALFG